MHFRRFERVEMSFNYSFDNDGGAVGLIDTEIGVAKNVVIFLADISTKEGLTSGGAATVQLALFNSGLNISPTLPFGAFVTGGVTVSISTVQPGDDAPDTLALRINTAPLTGGNFSWFIDARIIYF